jgi:hypothetical protein
MGTSVIEQYSKVAFARKHMDTVSQEFAALVKV